MITNFFLLSLPYVIYSKENVTLVNVSYNKKVK